MNYREAYDYLNSFTNYEDIPGSNYPAGMAGLSRVDLLMRLLGNPQTSFRSIVIAGTKGKGSVAAMIDSALREGDYVTGLYISPHLHTFRERIRVNGTMIPSSDVVRLVEKIQPMVEKIRSLGEPSYMPTTYELTTAMAFLYFQEQSVQVAVLEVGLGGRLDAVNIVEPVASVITSISLDHTQVLGNSISEIAEEKAGIIKRNGLVISAPQNDEAMEVIKRVAMGQQARLEIVSQDVYVSTQHLPEVISDEEGIPIYQAFTIAYGGRGEEPDGRVRVRIPLLGNHQQVNAATALATLLAISSRDIPIGREAIVRGFGKVVWPGRLEIVRREPLIVLDGAHNADSMAKLSQAMNDLFYKRKLVVVLGISSDKDIRGIIVELSAGPANLLGPKVEKVIVTKSRHPRAAYPAEIARIAQEQGLFAEVRDELPEALATAMSAARAGAHGDETDPIVVVTGSLFIVAEAREYFGLAPDPSEE